MSRTARVVAAALLVLPASAHAQRAGAWRDSALRLQAQIKALNDSVASGDSTVSEVARRGRMVVWASDGVRSVANQVLDRFIGDQRRWFGSSSLSDDGFRIVLRWPSTRSRSGLTRTQETLILAELPGSLPASSADQLMARRGHEAHDAGEASL